MEFLGKWQRKPLKWREAQILIRWNTWRLAHNFGITSLSENSVAPEQQIFVCKKDLCTFRTLNCFLLIVLAL
jgi:hypothetical protein